MKALVRSFALIAFAAAPLAAQAKPAAKPAAPPAASAVSTMRTVWQPTANYVLQAAQDMPEEKFSFKPTPTVRSFGEVVAHVAGSQYMFCAAALGDTARAEDEIEKGTHSKADLVAAMKASTAYCDKAYAITDAAGRKPLTMFGQKHNRLWALLANMSHNGESYGNLITYLRINGMVPPSSKRQ